MDERDYKAMNKNKTIGGCGKHIGQSMINCPLCATENFPTLKDSMENKTKEEILKSIIYKHGEGENYSNVIFAMQEYADQQSDHDKQTIIGLKLQLQAMEKENKELKKSAKELSSNSFSGRWTRALEQIEKLESQLTSKDAETEELKLQLKTACDKGFEMQKEVYYKGETITACEMHISELQSSLLESESRLKRLEEEPKKFAQWILDDFEMGVFEDGRSDDLCWVGGSKYTTDEMWDMYKRHQEEIRKYNESKK